MTQASINHPFLSFMLNAVLAALTMDPNRDVEDLKCEREAAAAMLTALQPRDAIEAALAARAVVAHHAAMECFRRAALAEASELSVGRLFAKAMALSQMSMQMMRMIDARKRAAPGAWPSASANPLEAGLAGAPPRPRAPSPKDPMSSEPRPATQAAATPGNPAPGRTAPASRVPQNPTHPAAPGVDPAKPVAAPADLPPVMTREELAPFATLALAMMDAA
jgi:hypothetical protein